MWTQVVIVVLGASAVAFLAYFELAMFRELRSSRRTQGLIPPPHIVQPTPNDSPRVIAFPRPAENVLAQSEKAAR